MLKKIHFCLIGLVIISLPIFSSASIAQAPEQTPEQIPDYVPEQTPAKAPAPAQVPNYKPTMWVPIDKSMTELLDSGWKIANYSTYVHTVDTRGITSVTRTFETTHVYLLYKDGKNVSCMIDNPQRNNSYSQCRQLN
jgi:hypothetical protein